MNGLRYWSAAICIWLFFFFNLERLNPGINVASFVYIYTTVWAAIIILLPKVQRRNRYWIFVVVLLPYLGLKPILGYGVFGAYLPITVLEIGAISLTIFLAGQVSRGLENAEETVANLTIAHLRKDTTSFETGQGRLYQEIRRARYFERPATILAVSATEESLEFSKYQFVREAQQIITSQFVSARIAQLLVDQLKDCDIITQRNDHFVMLLPEVRHEDVTKIVEKLESAAEAELNLKLKIGVSSFPDEAITLESLLERAEQNMQSSDAQQADSSLPDPVTATADKYDAADEPISYVDGLQTVSMVTNSKQG